MNYCEFFFKAKVATRKSQWLFVSMETGDQLHLNDKKEHAWKAALEITETSTWKTDDHVIHSLGLILRLVDRDSMMGFVPLLKSLSEEEQRPNLIDVYVQV